MIHIIFLSNLATRTAQELKYKLNNYFTEETARPLFTNIV